MKTFKLVVRGRTLPDVELAIAESMRLIGNGNLSGFNDNEDGDFSFDSDGEFDEDEEEGGSEQ